MTKLEAVNEVLAVCGTLPVPALDTNGPSAAGMAERCIDEEERKVQTQGWHYNTRRDVELTPDGSDKIAVPTGAITIDTYGESYHRDITTKGGYLYDLDENTDEFDDSIKAIVVYRFAFTCIPQPVQDFIVASAAERYARLRNRADILPDLKVRTIKARSEARRFDGLSADINLLDTPEARAMAGFRSRRIPLHGEAYWVTGLPS